MRYLFDFASSFVILFGPLIMVMTGSVITFGIVLAAAWAIIPHIARRS